MMDLPKQDIILRIMEDTAKIRASGKDYVSVNLTEKDAEILRKRLEILRFHEVSNHYLSVCDKGVFLDTLRKKGFLLFGRRVGLEDEQ